MSPGHELVHAYYNALGKQADIDDGDSDNGTLYEYMAVGLGPWAGEPSENLLRSQIAPIVKSTSLGGLLKNEDGVLAPRPAYG